VRLPRPTRADHGRSPDGRMTLGEHLSELRYRVVVSLVAVLLTTIVAYLFHNHILHFLTRPYCEIPAKDRALGNRCTLVVSGVLDPFTVTLKVSLYAGILAASPVWLYQLWKFITPGLYAHEKRYASGFVAASVLLFAMGTAFAYLTLSKGLHWLLGFASGGITSLLQFNNYLSFVTAMVLVFAVSFEVPLLIVMLNMVGVLPAARLRKWWRMAIFLIFVFAAVATPSQDPFTMSALAIPMCLLYGVAVLLATVHDRRAAARGSIYGDLADDELSPIDDEPAVP
jgi:sec-independent protein translocase protein TatC